MYGWVERVSRQQDYQRQGKAMPGLLRRYVEKMTGLSRAQVTRLIGCYLATGAIVARPDRRHCFAERYTWADIELLAAVDEAHETLSGRPRGASSSASTRSADSRSRPIWPRSRSATCTTCASAEGIASGGGTTPGRGPGAKGVYHINAVEQVTQWQIVSANPTIS